MSISSVSSSGRIRPPRRRNRRNQRAGGTNPRKRRFALTLNNPTLAEAVKWQTVLDEGNDAPSADRLTYFIVQTEKGDGSPGDSSLGTVHYQAYCEFKTSVSWNTVKAIFGDRIHIEAARANSSANIRYCSKERTRYEDDTIGIRGRWGTAKTVGMVVCAIKALEGAKLETLVDEHPLVALLHMPKLEALIAHAKGKRDKVPKITILTGLTRCGKSLYCTQTFPDAYWVAPPDGGRVWWGHYVGQEVCILDDFHSGWFTLTYLLRLWDSTPLMVAPKGSQVPFTSSHLVLTSNVDPKDWYLHYKGKAAHKDALEARIKEFATIVDCSRHMSPLGWQYVRVERTEEFKFNEDDFSQPQAGVGDLPRGNNLPYGSY